MRLSVGPVRFRVGSAWAGLARALQRLYAGYPNGGEAADYSVRLEPTKAWRRCLPIWKCR